ncbi:hypothetical protein Ancab_040466 [Ancistrocladus abbreviatus]
MTKSSTATVQNRFQQHQQPQLPTTQSNPFCTTSSPPKVQAMNRENQQKEPDWCLCPLFVCVLLHFLFVVSAVGGF